MSEARQRILERLRANRPTATEAPATYTKPLGWDREQRINAFIERMHAVRGEVHRIPRTSWTQWIIDELPTRGLHRLLVGTGKIGDAVAAAVPDSLTAHRYDQTIEKWKSALFDEVDVAITGARAGLAETGSLVLWPDALEPRLMSLVPPVHIAVLDSDRLYENFADALQTEDWENGMPSNALLISGPSKTADIEQTLAYGIHGPKQLITLLLE